MSDGIEAVNGYLEVAFLGASIMDRRDFDRSAHTWSIREDGRVLLLTVSFEFLTDTPSDTIDATLRRWETAETLRTDGGAHRLLVTTEGLRWAGR